MLFGNTKTSNLVILYDLRYLTGNISSVITKHMGVQRKLHRFAAPAETTSEAYRLTIRHCLEF